MVNFPVSVFGYEKLSSRRMETLREEMLWWLNPEFMLPGTFLSDSDGRVSRMISGILGSEYNCAGACGTELGIELLIHLLAGQSMPTKRDPFIDESLVVPYLLDRNAKSVVVLQVGEDQLPAIRGLDAAVMEFDKVVNGLNLDSIFGLENIFGHRRIYSEIPNPTDKFYSLGLGIRGTVLQIINSDPKFKKKMQLLYQFQNALPFHALYGDQYLDVRSDLVQDGVEFRLAVIQDLIRIFRAKNQPVEEELGSLEHSLQNAFNFDGLQVSYGNPRDNIRDSVPSCVSGLIGTMREASIVYEADPNIEIIGMVPYLCPSILNPIAQKRLDQIVKAITVKVHDREADDETKLMVDGVIADDRLGDMLGVDWRPYMAIGILKYAQAKGIAKVIINAENSDSHESVNSFKYFIATEVLGLQEGIDFSYKIDSRTGNHVFRLERLHIRNQIDNFSYTHVLDKDPMPESKVKRLANGRPYHGEAYLDAWHEWMVHVNNHRDRWGIELKTRFPYVEKRDPNLNPVWNLGRGPVVGMELDVSSVLPILQKRYLSN